MRKVTIQTKVEPAMKGWLIQKAKSHGMTVSAYVNHLLTKIKERE